MNRQLFFITYFMLKVFIPSNAQTINTQERSFEELRTIATELATLNPDSAAIFGKKLTDLAMKSKSDLNIAKAYSTNALIKIWQSLPDSALILNEKSFAINQKLKNEVELANNYFLFGKVAQNKSDYVNATKYFLKSNEIAKKHKLYSLIQNNFRSLSNTSFNENNYNKALKYAQKALEIEQLSPNDQDRANDLAMFGPCYVILGKVDLAVKAYDEAYRLFAKDKNYFKMGYIICQKSVMYEESDPVKSIEMEYEGQKFYDRIAAENINSIINIGNIGTGLFAIAQSDSLINRIQNSTIPKSKPKLLAMAETYLNRCLTLAKKKKSLYTIEYFSTPLSELQAYNSDYKNAYANLKFQTKLADSLFSQENKNEIAKLESEKEVLQLTSENKEKSTQNKILIGLTFGLLALAFLGYRNFKNRQEIATQQQTLQQQKITELEKDQQLQSIDSMLKGQEDERNRIAKDLHDGLGGMLSGVKMSFMNMKENLIMSSENVSVFERSISQLDSTIIELRKVAHNLMPEALVRFGLNDAIKDFCTSMTTSTHINIVYESMGETRELDNTANVYIYRIIQELVNNAIKHGQPNQVFVQLTTTLNKILITVEDDGKGLDVNTLATSKGVGISNIKHRVNYFKGLLEFDAKSPNGTVVNIELNV